MAGIIVQLKLLGLLLLVLLEIAAVVANVNHVVRFASGINNNDTLRRFWSRSESVIFYPVKWPMLLSWVQAWGVHAIVRSILVGLLQMLDAVKTSEELSLAGIYTVLLAASVSGSMASMILFRTCGGINARYQSIGTIVLTLAVSISHLFVHRHPSPGVLALWVCAMIVATGAIGWWASQITRNRTSTTVVRELMPDRSKIEPPQTGNTSVIAFVCVLLLVVVRIWDELLITYIRSMHYEKIYLAQVLRNFGRLMVLIQCSFVSIRIINAFIGRRPLTWYWWSMHWPVWILAVEESILYMIREGLFRGGSSSGGHKEFVSVMKHVLVPLFFLLDRLAMYATAAFLGCAVYLGVLARAAMNALDPGFEGQSELILDDDDSDYDLDP